MVQEVTEQAMGSVTDMTQAPDRDAIGRIQRLLSSQRFQDGIQAWRVYYRLYGDTEPVPEVEIRSKPPDTQKEVLQTRKQDTKDIIDYSWPFALERDEHGKYRFAVGHKTNDLWGIGEAKLCKGMYARLAGVYEGIVLIQLDSDKSRQLYDEDTSLHKERFFRILLSALVNSTPIQKKGDAQEGKIKDQFLVVVDHEFRPLQVVDIGGRTYRHNPKATWYLPQTAEEPYYLVDYSLLTTSHQK